ncbi:MAG: hypothetical protein FWG23_00600 [Eggerthellaceae bacterium]|nr:hypothetical protein [Eggerthellaceae bacterium]
MFGAEFFEALMIISFGIAWPTSILKSIRSKTSKGKSLLFMVVVFFGYAFGISSKLIGHNISYVLIFYVINLCMVGTDIVLFFINRRNDERNAGTPVAD